MSVEQSEIEAAAKAEVEQWDNHDRFRDHEGLGEPTSVKIARDYLARLAADRAEREEREEPIDEAWLRSVGFVREQHFAIIRLELSGYKTQVNVNIERGYVSLGQMDECESEMEMVAIRKMTRGQLLDLLSAIGVERKGGA